MIDLPINAEVVCSDGVVGPSTYVIANPINRQITHLVVKSNRPPFHETLVPVDMVNGTTSNKIKLECTRDNLKKMEPFEVDEYIRTKLPSYLVWPYATPAVGYQDNDVDTYVPVKRQNISSHEVALRRGAKVEATDGYIGLVDELLINSKNMQVTHIILLERHIFKQREITIPVSQIELVNEDTVYLKLDRQSVEQLPTTPIQRWPQYMKDSKLERIKKMDKMLVVVFDNEAKAYEGSKALQELQNEGSLNQYAKAVIVRDASGMLVVKQQDDKGPVGTAVGMLTGSLVGLLGGPVGLVLGAGAGTFGGLLYDLAQLGINQDFLADIEQTLQPGKAAVIAEVWEEWMLPVDTRMETLGGTVLRRTRSEFLDKQIEQDVAALQTDIENLEAEYNQATGEAAAKIQKKADTARDRLQAKKEDIRARIEASQQEAEAKIKSLQEQASKQNGERKAKLETRIAELKSEQEQRNAQIKHPWDNIKKAL